jgi:hypothetical protein
MWKVKNIPRFFASDNVTYKSRGTDPRPSAECRNLPAISTDICSAVEQKSLRRFVALQAPIKKLTTVVKH